MTYIDKKKRIESNFQEAHKALSEKKTEKFLLYIGCILGLLETLDGCGKETTDFRNKTLEHIHNLNVLYKKGSPND